MYRTGEYKLAQQFGLRGFYAKVSVQASLDASPGILKIEFAPEFCHAYPEFRIAIESGIKFAWNESRHADPSIQGLQIREVRLNYHDTVDTTPKCVAYAAAGAVLNAIGLDRLLPPFDPDKDWEELTNTQPENN